MLGKFSKFQPFMCPRSASKLPGSCHYGGRRCMGTAAARPRIRANYPGPWVLLKSYWSSLVDYGKIPKPMDIHGQYYYLKQSLVAEHAARPFRRRHTTKMTGGQWHSTCKTDPPGPPAGSTGPRKWDLSLSAQHRRDRRPVEPAVVWGFRAEGSGGHGFRRSHHATSHRFR